MKQGFCHCETSELCWSQAPSEASVWAILIFQDCSIYFLTPIYLQDLWKIAPLIPLGARAAQFAPSPKISGDDRNDQKGEWFIGQLRHISLGIGREGCNEMCGILFFSCWV